MGGVYWCPGQSKGNCVCRTQCAPGLSLYYSNFLGFPILVQISLFFPTLPSMGLHMCVVVFFPFFCCCIQYSGCYFSLFFFSLLRLKRTLESATKGIFQITSAADIYIYIYIYVFLWGRRGAEGSRERSVSERREIGEYVDVCALYGCVCV